MMGRWSGALWLLGAAVAAACQPLPGVDHDHAVLAWILIAGLAFYGVACITEWIPWRRAPIWAHLVAVLAFQPVLGVALWASGGVNSYIFPVLVLAMLYSAYFLPGWMAWVGVGALAVTYASTLLYTDVDSDQALARVLAFALACEGMTLTLQTLKRRLIDAEQRADAAGAAGLPGRVTVGAALAQAIAASGDGAQGRRLEDPGHVTLLLVGLGDDPSGGALEALADRARTLLRPSDVVAPAADDQLAIVAAGAGHDGARRMAQALRVAAAQHPVVVHIGWAVYPEDGTSAPALLEAVDRALRAPDA